MICAAYFLYEKTNEPVVVATFLMRSDAERFSQSYFGAKLHIKEISNWNKSWPQILEEIKESLENE